MDRRVTPGDDNLDEEESGRNENCSQALTQLVHWTSMATMRRAPPMTVVETPEFLSVCRKLMNEDEHEDLTPADRKSFKALVNTLIESYARRTR